MAREHLRVLADGLAKLKPDQYERFDMIDWYSEGNCDSAACAIGWVPRLIPDCELRLTSCTIMPGGTRIDYEPVCDDEYGWDAVEKYFEIPFGVSRDLFDHRSYEEDPVTPGMVAERIYDYLDNKQP